MEQTMFFAQPRKPPAAMRAHDYLFDPAFIVSGAKDYARMAFAAALKSSQVTIQPVYQTMFSEIRRKPRSNLLYHPNCRLPDHMVCSHEEYRRRRASPRAAPSPHRAGKDRYKFSAVPRELPAETITSEPDFVPPHTQQPKTIARPRNRKIQTQYRESSAQTVPWQPGAFASAKCEAKPEVLYLDKLEWGPGEPYRTGDLPADFHTTEIINKMRHARRWMAVAECGGQPRWMKRRGEIVKDVETKDWIFREAEIDELQEIRLFLLHRLQAADRSRIIGKQTQKLHRLWSEKKRDMEEKIGLINRVRDRELRKLRARHAIGGRAGQVALGRAARGHGPSGAEATDPAGGGRAPAARHGYQARRRHRDIVYDPSLLVYEDHRLLDEPPAWLERCPQKLKETCSGHYLKPDPHTLCERETKWSEDFLKNLHEELIKARLGAATAAGPLRVLKPRRVVGTARAPTPAVDAVPDADEAGHQAALTLQRLVRGRAVQMLDTGASPAVEAETTTEANVITATSSRRSSRLSSRSSSSSSVPIAVVAIMYEGRTRAAELTEELKTTHGLQKEDRIRIAREEARARDYDVVRSAVDQKEEAISALVDEVCGGAVSAALDFLEKELGRLREERRQHAFILIALREKALRESAEAGRRQKEARRLREHDEMFKRVLGVTQDTVDAYLKDVATEGMELYAEADAVARAKSQADEIDASLVEHGSMSTAEQNELVAELVQGWLLPATHQAAARQRVCAAQRQNADAARRAVFDYFDEAEDKRECCVRCGEILDETCRCRQCGGGVEPSETPHRRDPRWKFATRRELPAEKDVGERIPPQLEFRCLLDAIVDEAVEASRARAYEMDKLVSEVTDDLTTRFTIAIDAAEIMEAVVKDAVGETCPPAKPPQPYRHAMRRLVPGALERSEPYPDPDMIPVPSELPSAIRQKQMAQEDAKKPWCRCESPSQHKRKVVRLYGLELMSDSEKSKLLPSELRILEDMRRCKCDDVPSPTPTDAEPRSLELSGAARSVPELASSTHGASSVTHGTSVSIVLPEPSPPAALEDTVRGSGEEAE